MREKGQTMIEVLLALAIGVIIIAGISKVVNTSLSNSQFGKNQSSANQYAQEGMEIVRNIRPTGSYCLAKGQTTLGSGNTEDTTNGCPQNVDAFAREVNIQGTDVKKVTVTVAWSDSKCFGPTPMPTSTPTPTPRVAGTLGFRDPTSTPIPTSIPTPILCQSTSSTSYLSSVYCHRVQLVSCLSSSDTVPTP